MKFIRKKKTHWKGKGKAVFGWSSHRLFGNRWLLATPVLSCWRGNQMLNYQK